MIYFRGHEVYSNGDAVYKLWADAKADVVEGAEIIGFPEGRELVPGSYVLTGDFHIGQYLTNGTWSWDDAEESNAKSASLKLSSPALDEKKSYEEPIIEELDEDPEEIDE